MLVFEFFEFVMGINMFLVVRDSAMAFLYGEFEAFALLFHFPYSSFEKMNYLFDFVIFIR